MLRGNIDFRKERKERREREEREREEEEERGGHLIDAARARCLLVLL